MEQRTMKHLLMGASALTFGALIASKYYKKQAAAATAAAASPANAAAAAAPATSSSSSSSSAATTAAVPAPAAKHSVTIDPKPPLSVAITRQDSNAPSLSRANSLGDLSPTCSNPTTPRGGTSTTDRIVKNAIKAEAKLMPRPLVVCGPSGVGKGTLLGMILKEFPEHFAKTISHTTRQPRTGEVNGQHYHFVTIEQMKKDIADHKFVESCNVHGNLYGTSIAAVHAVATTGKVCILEIDIQGAEKVRKTDLKPHYMFILPPTLESLTERLDMRGTETAEAIAVRLRTAKEELDKLQRATYFEYQIVNNGLEAAYRELRSTLLECYPHLRDHVSAQTAAAALAASGSGSAADGSASAAAPPPDAKSERLLREQLEQVERLKAKVAANKSAAAGTPKAK